jgi:hypothetical protein
MDANGIVPTTPRPDFQGEMGPFVPNMGNIIPMIYLLNLSDTYNIFSPDMGKENPKHR